jgi:glycogen debranching enzyme
MKEASEVTTVVKVDRINQMWSYVLPDNKLVTGSSYGNKKCYANSKATGAIENLFSIDIGRNVIGSMVVRYFDSDSNVLLEQTGTGNFIIHPSYQKRKFALVGDIRVSEVFYVPNSPEDDLDRCQAAYLGLKLRNKSNYDKKISVVAYADLCSTYLGTSSDLEISYCYQGRAIVARNRSNLEWVRVFGATAEGVHCSITNDVSLTTDDFNVTENSRSACVEKGDDRLSVEQCFVQVVPATVSTPKLNAGLTCEDTLIGRVQVDIELYANSEKDFSFIIGFSPNGEKEAITTFEKLSDYEKAYRATISNFVSECNRSELVTPDSVINRGVQWAKANMMRVKSEYPQGVGFTNDPSKSSNIVARDTAWFAFGCDYVDPEFSKAALRVFKKYQGSTGMIIEYYNGVTGEVDDYQLNINDDTPLYILAVVHTYQITGDELFLKEMYSSVEKAADYIASQMDVRGLVFCSATGMGIYGICGWRNVIPNYAINGAVTEVNSECFSALTSAALLADLVGYHEKARHYRSEAKRLRNAINNLLINPKNGLYYLNVDIKGNAHPDVTCDLVFPVIFNVASPAMSHLIIDRLNRPDFLTSAGLRTVPRTALGYHPEAGWGLTGGIWPDVAFMFAFACSTHQPDVMVNIMRGAFRQYELDPTNQNTVPGQFSEWYHGESFVNNGMKLSPWFPPKYLWTALEGVCGISLYRGLNLNPNMPLWWKWLGLSNFSYHNNSVSYFAGRIHGVLNIFANYPFSTNLENLSHNFERDITDMIRERHDDVYILALGTTQHIVVCVGNITTSSISFTFYVDNILSDYAEKSRYLIRVFHSEIDDWYDHGTKEYGNIGGFTISLEAGGFKIIELTAQQV